MKISDNPPLFKKTPPIFPTVLPTPPFLWEKCECHPFFLKILKTETPFFLKILKTERGMGSPTML